MVPEPTAASTGLPPSGQATAGAASSETAGTTYPSATIDTTGTAAAKVRTELKAILLTPSEVGTGFTSQALPDAAPGAKGVCGQVSTATLFPNSIRAGVALAKGQDAQLQEAVSVYVDAAGAAKAHAHDVSGVSCTSGTLEGTPFTLGDHTDVTKQVGGTDAQAWSIDLGSASGVLIAIQDQAVTVNLTFLVATGVDSSGLASPTALAKKAVQKIEKS